MHPSGLPGHAVLIVRRLELPVADRGAGQLARAALGRLRQGAARPAVGPVAADAQAVLFGDEVELLACLTADLVRGVASQRWYWRQIDLVRARRPGGGPGGRLAQGCALAAGQLRPPPRARGQASPVAALPAGGGPGATGLLSCLRCGGPALSRRDQAGPARAEPPWRRWLRPTSLPPEAEALWGVALSLHHAPAVVRGAQVR